MLALCGALQNLAAQNSPLTPSLAKVCVEACKQCSELESIYKAPDAIGNLFRTEERKDRKYGKDRRLLEDKKFSYHYDGEGNLVLKQRLRPDETLAPFWQEGDWAYEWQGNGLKRKSPSQTLR